MTHAIDPALSALRAFGSKLGVTSNNIANVDTEGFKKSRVILEEAPSGGVNVSISRVLTPGAPLPPDRDSGQSRETSNVAVEEEMVDLVTTRQAYTANLKVIQAEDQTLGTLLDILEK